jgi:hypothetical protein
MGATWNWKDSYHCGDLKTSAQRSAAEEVSGDGSDAQPTKFSMHHRSTWQIIICWLREKANFSDSSAKFRTL